MGERLVQPSRTATRLSRVLKYATPESTIARWIGPHIRRERENYLSYPLDPRTTFYNGDDSPVHITADYRSRRIPFPIRLKPVEAAGWGLRRRGENTIFKKPAEIDAFLAQFGETEAERVEALLVHRMIRHAEGTRKLSRWNTSRLELQIAHAHSDQIATVIAGQDGNARVYLPYLGEERSSASAKMIRVITDQPTGLSDAENEQIANDARSLILIPEVQKALNENKYHALSIQKITDATGDHVIITDPRGRINQIDLPREHQNEGGFDSDIARAYAESRHGVDGRLMDPDVARVLETYAPGKTVADIGMGAGPVAIDAIKAGAARVYGLDNSEAMLDRANAAITKAENEGTIAQGSIQTFLGSAESLPNPPYQDNSADLVLSVNTGCAVPSEGIFESHFSEMARIATPDGKILVTAPTTFGEVFTSGKLPKDKVLEKIGLTLIEINRETFGQDETAKIRVLREKMGKLAEVNRATFVLRDIVDQDGADKKFVLVYDGRVPQVLKDVTIRESALKRGEPIERKLAGGINTTGLVVPNFYHPREEYLEAIRDAGLTIVGGAPIHNVMTQRELSEYNRSLPQERQLGQEYLANSPFDIYLLTK